MRGNDGRENMKCIKCGMSHYLPTWYGERSCPCCGHFPESGRALPPDILDTHSNRKLSSLALNKGGVVEGGYSIKDHDYNPQRVIRRGCRWWQGRLADGTKKMCFNCGWSDCVKNDQIGEGNSKNYGYKAREAKDFTIIHPDGAPKEDCYDPREREKYDTSPSHLVYRDSAIR